MQPRDWWLVGFGLRCAALCVVEIAALLFVVPTLFNLHSDAADAVAALGALVAIGGGIAATLVLSREVRPSLEDRRDD